MSFPGRTIFNLDNSEHHDYWQRAIENNSWLDSPLRETLASVKEDQALQRSELIVFLEKYSPETDYKTIRKSYKLHSPCPSILGLMDWMVEASYQQEAKRLWEENRSDPVAMVRVIQDTGIRFDQLLEGTDQEAYAQIFHIAHDLFGDSVGFDFDGFIEKSFASLDASELRSLEVASLLRPYMSQEEPTHPSVLLPLFILASNLLVAKEKLSSLDGFSQKRNLENFVSDTLTDVKSGKSIFGSHSEGNAIPVTSYDPVKDNWSGTYNFIDNEIDIGSTVASVDMYFSKKGIGLFLHEAYHRWQDKTHRSVSLLDIEYETHEAVAVLSALLPEQSRPPATFSAVAFDAIDVVVGHGVRLKGRTEESFSDLAQAIISQSHPNTSGSALGSVDVPALQQEAKIALNAYYKVAHLQMMRRHIRELGDDGQRAFLEEHAYFEEEFEDPESFFGEDNEENYERYENLMAYLACKLDQFQRNSPEYKAMFRDEILPTLTAIPFLESVYPEFKGV